MKNLIVSAIAFAALIFTPIFISASSCKKFISIQNAIENNLVSLQMQSLGGHSENCVQCITKNNTNDSIFIEFEAGRVLDNTNAAEQDILVTHALKLRIAAHKTKDTVAYGFCCQSGNSGPSYKQKYIVGNMADSASVVLANFLNTHITSASKAQNAVWVLSNNHTVSSIAEASDTAATKLIALCCKLKHVQVPPWHHQIFMQVPGKVFSGIINNIIAEINYNKRTNNELQAFVCDSTGKIIKTLATQNFAANGNIKFRFDIQVVNWKKGTYTIKIFENKETALEKKFTV